MSNFHGHNKIIEIIEHDSNLLPVINRFDIKLGFGDINVNQICLNKNIDIEFFLAIINVYHNESYFPQYKFLNFNIENIINYLNKTHHYYNQYIIPEIERLLAVLLQNETKHKDIFLLLEKVFVNFKNEFIKHIEYEENIIFPKILELENSQHKEIHKTNKLQEFNFENIHNQLDDKIIDIKNILFKYLPPMYDFNNCNAFAIAIFQFEKDLKDHARIEDRILFPKVKDFFQYLKT